MTHADDHRAASASPSRHLSGTGTVPALVEAAASRSPHAVALVRGSRSYTYAELAARFSRTARALRARGVASGDVVAVRGGRSPETVVAMLAVLRAGAVLTMIDVSQPDARVHDVIKRARPSLLVDTTEQTWDPAAGAAPVVRLAELEQAAAGEIGLPAVAAGADAYVCFTSGTTGEPRGVLGWHGALAHFCVWEQEALAMGAGDRVAQMAALTFDAVFKDLFPALIAGATVCLPPTDRPFVDLAQVLAWLREDEVTVLQTVPSVLSSLLAELPAGAGFPALRLICLSGEPLQGGLVNRWRQATGNAGARFVNLYGTTEATILKSWYPVPDDEVPAVILPVGKAIDDAELLVVSKRGRRCGVGEPGEVLIRTPHLTRGAWRPAEGEAPLFEVNPLNPDDPTDLVQRTGDLGRLGPQGDLEIHGRVDDQIKILGVRVHPAEVAALITRMPEVEDAAVVARAGDDGPMLVAYVVPGRRAAVDASAVRRHVAATGSNALVPAHVVLLERLPLTGHGKLDRSALPDPDSVAGAEHADGAVDEGQWTGTERRVAELWSELFKKEITSRHAHFFDLGGHSLMLARLLARIRRTFEVDLNLPTLFRSATIATLAEAVDGALRAGGPAEEEPVPLPVPRDGDQPLSPEQEGLWFLQQLDPRSSSYNMAGVFQLPAGIGEEAVRAAFITVCARHEALRLRFHEVDGRPVQSVGEAALDFAALTAVTDRPSGLTSLSEAAAVAFDLVDGPLVRVRTVRVGGDELLVGLTVHHLCCDGVSWSLLAQQADELLSGVDRHTHLDHGGPRFQFGDYAAWRAGRKEGERAEADLAYWCDMLADSPDAGVPWGRPVPLGRPHRARVLRVEVAPDVTNRVAELCAKAGATEYMAMMTVLAYVMSRAAAQDRVVIGSDSVGRGREEFEELIGFFVRTHAYSFDMAGDPTFEEALGRVRATLVEASGHQDVSFARVVEAVAAARDGDRSPLFSVMLRMPPREELPREAAVLRPVDVVADAADGSGAAPTAKFDLTVVVRPGPAGTLLDFEYDADTVQAEFAAALGERFTRLLRFAAEQPASPLSDARRSSHPFAEPLPARDLVPVAERFRRQASATPDAVAVSCAEGEVTYSRLAAAVAGAARELRPGRRVGVLGGKSPATVAALLAAVGVGTTVVLLDDGLPAPRRAAMMAKAGVQHVLLTEPSTATDGPGDATVRRLSFEELAEGAHEVLGAVPARPLEPAYVFFTSGTTGEAKGVVGSHRGLDHFIDWEAEEFGVHGGDRVAQLTTLSFDAMLRDVFVPLTQGATLCLPPAGALDDAARTVDWLARERVTIVHTTPSVAASWLEGSDRGTARLTDLRLLCLAGEPLTGRLVQDLREGLLGPHTEVVNFYGPTETTMIKMFHRVTSEQDTGPVPVGRPLPGAQAVVLGVDGTVRGPGERGEIVIRTPYRTLGYLDDARAGSHFRPNPLSDDPADLVYHTGDIAVVGASGEIQVEGRSDDLLKVRGVRVHPAEVAAELTSHPQVRQVHVEADKEADGSLVAYVVRAPGSVLTTEELRRHARERLPLAVVPSLFLFVDRFALLPNGKLDRSSLGSASSPAAQEHVRPRDDNEALIWSMWSELLGHGDFGVTDDFFAVGGHSLLATILLTRIRKKTGLSMSLRKLLEGPRVDRLAASVRELLEESDDQASDVLLPLRQGTAGGPLLFLVHPIGGDVLCFRDMAAALPVEFTVIGVRSPGLDGGTAFTSVQEMAAAYLHEVRRTQPEGPYHFAGWSMGGAIAYEMARQLSFEGVRTASVVLLDSYAPGSKAFEHFADPEGDRVASFADDLERMTGERADTTLLSGVRPPAGEEQESLLRRFTVFDANATALVDYRMRRTRLKDTRLTLVLAGDQSRPEGMSPALGWEEALGTPVETRAVPGADHFTLVQRPHAAVTAREIARAVEPGTTGRDEGRG
ncbi:amino acid adenylation domain-containing protein [Streptomyces sp. NBC_01341]|uniref:non-ribosomal peptide synthetase n=1 Tax=Streptomyces sp. NBC_01341 TaxID=2903831 RepID=UPI002E12D8C5|nr:non-ribosomal peptide synthetase [Streptomyces sp. NBC_01341]WSI29792.1 amino acid adenylation domain-containing protein [Streptomyces sp. NBC_01341]